jgi:D-3-phosphoglycerate dehydrogenase
MKPTAYLINASRGVNVNEEALYRALQEGTIAGAGLDTYVDEPKAEGREFTKKFRELDNVVLSSHLGASTHEAQVKTGIETAEVVIGFLTTGGWHNAVNVGEEVDVREKPTWPVFIFHRDKPGVFAHLDHIFAEHNINIREISGRRFADRNTATAVYMIEGEPDEQLLAALEEISDVLCVKR